ncbi:DNA methyltransferase [Polaromonas sp.]|uniref:DNA methyltransferase n=1 Tax=Polaromonas sp. TaxID=1869339 RepID=UPI0025E6D53A|nr:DNA methyltransferase [Polaromonas sp.]
MQDATPPDTIHPAQSFIGRWQGVTASELSTAQSFVRELCELLSVAVPHATAEQDYMFERPITFNHGDGSSSPGRIDCYRKGHFVLEAKKLKAPTHTKGFDGALMMARAQAENYARALPPEDGRPPFLLVVDVGNVIEVYSEFTRSGATYTPFPDPRSHRIPLAMLADADVRERLKRIWTDPESLNPTRASARVTRQVATQLAELARSLEQSGHRADHVAAFLTRCLFSMFAEDVELLPRVEGKGGFLNLLQTHRDNPAALEQMLRVLWTDMDRGGFSAALATQVLKFNGKLFKESGASGYSLLLNKEQIERLINAARANWREVEPAIFGTLLERALDPTERHALGAHYTPRAYVERLVLPTVVEPLRADWLNAQTAALVLAREAAELTGKDHDKKMEEARAEVRRFHHQLCTTSVLDPACGSGNFLYVTLEHLKRLEGEVLNQLADLGETQDKLGFESETVTPQQLLGVEINERAAALAELVLWIGYLQWHIRTRGNKAVAEPVVHDYGNIEHRDAVLAWADSDLAYDADGQLLSRWDGKTFKTHPVTGALVPDEAALVPQWKYIKPAQAKWPQTDFIVGNPPFIGASTMRAALGDGYVEALRKTWPDVPESADFVMYWWHHAACAVRDGKARRFGFITTNSLRQTFNRRVVDAQLSPPPAKRQFKTSRLSRLYLPSQTIPG